MRRQYLTHPRFQISFTTSFIIGVLFIVVLIGGITILSLFLLSRDPLVTDAQKIVFLTSARELGVYLLVVTAASVLVFGFIGFYLSYKFVGPLYRLESWMEERMNEKDYLPIRLRPGDEMEGVADVLNRLILKKFGIKKGD